jgi:hypothetical protein
MTDTIARGAANQAGAIGIVAKDFTTIKSQRIDCPGPRCPLAQSRT